MKSLSKDADKMLCILYRAYLSNRQNGVDKYNAKHYSYSEIKALKPFDSWNDEDTKATISELSRAGFGTMFMDCGFMANDEFVIHMENRFKNGLKEVIDFISSLPVPF